MTAAARETVDGYLTVPRLKDRKPVDVAISYIYQPMLSTLHIFTDWSHVRGDWRTHRTYTVRPFACDLPGRAVRLTKRDSDEVYDLLLADGGDTCDCKGFVGHGHCVHRDVLRAMVDEGQLDG